MDLRARQTDGEDLKREFCIAWPSGNCVTNLIAKC